jgi:hypothetical protein
MNHSMNRRALLMKDTGLMWAIKMLSGCPHIQGAATLKIISGCLHLEGAAALARG